MPVAAARPAPLQPHLVLVKRLLCKPHGIAAISLRDAHWWHVSLFDTAVVTEPSQEGVRRVYDALYEQLGVTGADTVRLNRSRRSAYCAVMSERLVPSVRPQPMIAVANVVQSSQWYQQVLGATSGHGGAEYEQLLVDGVMILQLHRLEVGHHHGAIADPEPIGNGVAVWFDTDDFDAAVGRIRDVAAEIVTDVYLNPNAGHREIWIRDVDGYLIVLAEAPHRVECR